MPRLTVIDQFTRRMRVGAPERGAVSSIVAILLVGGVAFGAAAISIDVGQLLWERREVQNGADAAALSAAQVCAAASNCTVDSARLTALAGANAQDGRTSVTTICRSSEVVSASLPVCASDASAPPSTTANLVQCATRPASADALPYLEAYSETLTSGGSAITSLLASAAAGSAKTTTVKACSRAAWGPVAPSSLKVFPVLMSYCDWKNQTGYTGTPGSAVYPSPPDPTITPYGYGGANPWPSVEQTVYTKNNPTTCPTWNGHTAPGGFYSTSTSQCSSSVVLNDWVQGTTGNASPCTTLGTDPKAGDTIYMPIFDCMFSGPTTITPTTDCNTGNGSNTYYHIAGYAAFYITGWYFSSDSKASIKSGIVPCSGGDRCMSGWFLKDLVAAGDIVAPTPGGPPNFGLSRVKPIG